MSKNILITGASGFIGSFMVEKALISGYSVWAGIRKSSKLEYLQDQRLQFIDLDYANTHTLSKQVDEFIGLHGNIDYIIHCAGITKSVKTSSFEKINFQYTANLINALNTSECILDKFILISSLSVMGKGDELNYSSFDEETVPHPVTAYGRSKLKAEQYLENKARFPHMVLRPTGVYGPRERDYLMMVKMIRSRLDIKVGFKPQQLTFIYIKDLVTAAFLALESNKTDKKYFISDGQTYTDQEYTKKIKDILGKKVVLNLRVPLFLLKFISILAENVSRITKKPSTLNKDKYIIIKQRNWKCNITPITTELGFSPKYSLDEGLKESIDWYEQNGWL